jgi:exosortase
MAATEAPVNAPTRGLLGSVFRSILPDQSPSRQRPWASRLLAVALGAGFLCAFWATLVEMADRWTHEPEYSHGYLVPVFALYLLWHRRELYAPASFRGSLWGLVLLAAAVGVRLAGVYFHFTWLGALSLVPGLFGVTLLLGGRNAVRWAWPALTFLLFMLPLPYQVERALAHPLQRLATQASTCSLETLGLQALAEGNVIRIGDDVKIGVAEACGGLSMLLTFFALAAAFALVVRRPAIDKVVLVASAIPIALLANVIRITVTGALYDLVGSQAAKVFFHDLAGWFMMLLALGMLWLEVWVLSRLLLEPKAPGSYGT